MYEPHSGCTSLNPTCRDDECQCKFMGNSEMEWNGIWNSISLENLEYIICNNVTASVCGYYGCQW